jgi:hypothetical protein
MSTSTITISLGVYASLVVLWYVLKGDIDARWKVILFGLAAASLSFMTSAAARAWQVADTAITSLMHVQSNAAGVTLPWL